MNKAQVSRRGGRRSVLKRAVELAYPIIRHAAIYPVYHPFIWMMRRPLGALAWRTPDQLGERSFCCFFARQRLAEKLFVRTDAGMTSATRRGVRPWYILMIHTENTDNDKTHSNTTTTTTTTTTSNNDSNDIIYDNCNPAAAHFDANVPRDGSASVPPIYLYVYMHSRHVSEMFRKCVGNVSEMFRKCFGNGSEVFRKCFGNVSEMFRPPPHQSQKKYEKWTAPPSAEMLRKCCATKCVFIRTYYICENCCGTNMLRECCGNVALFGGLDFGFFSGFNCIFWIWILFLDFDLCFWISLLFLFNVFFYCLFVVVFVNVAQMLWKCCGNVVHNIFDTFPKHVRNISTTFPNICSDTFLKNQIYSNRTNFLAKYVRHISESFPKHFRNIFETFPNHFRNISETFSKHVHNISTTFPHHFHNVSTTFPRHFHNISETFPKHVHKICWHTQATLQEGRP